MDLGTVIGYALAWGAVIASLIMQKQNAMTLIDYPSLVLVVFGTIGAGIVGVSMQRATGIVGVVRKALFNAGSDGSEFVATLVDFANKARRDGLLSLEAELEQLDDGFLRRGVQLVVDGTPPEVVRDVLGAELSASRQRHEVSVKLFVNLGSYAPALGVIGTVMGLIAMLQSLDDPGAMGPAIATAFLTTLYGAVSANILYMPMANKLKYLSDAEAQIYEMTTEGIMALQAGDNPYLVQAKMLAFLEPAIREQLEADDEPAGAVGAPIGTPEMAGAE